MAGIPPSRCPGNFAAAARFASLLQSAGFYGYGVYNQGRLALDDSSVTRTSGLMNVGGVAALKDSRVTDNVPPSGYLHPGGGMHAAQSLAASRAVLADASQP